MSRCLSKSTLVNYFIVIEREDARPFVSCFRDVALKPMMLILLFGIDLLYLMVPLNRQRSSHLNCSSIGSREPIN